MILEMLTEFGITGPLQTLIEFVMLLGVGKIALDLYNSSKK